MYDFLQRDIDCQRLDKLIEIVKGGSCTVFTGAGISKPLRYRTWGEGITAVGGENPTLCELAGYNYNDHPDLNLPEIIDVCKDRLGEQYFDFLKKEFGRDGKEQNDGTLYALWKTNFKAFITTNFDATLYDHRENCEKFVTYPNKDLDYYDQRTLYYIHGRAFMVDNEDQETLKYYLSNLIYGYKSYREEYEEVRALEPFFFKLLQKRSLLFIGFSMTDVDFKRMFEQIRDRWSKYYEKLLQHPQKKEDPLKEHFILLPYSVRENFEKDEDYKKSDEIFLDKKSELLRSNILTIGYKKRNSDISEHFNLKKVLSLLKDKAPYAPLPILLELGSQQYGSGSASEKRF